MCERERGKTPTDTDRAHERAQIDWKRQEDGRIIAIYERHGILTITISTIIITTTILINILLL